MKFSQNFNMAKKSGKTKGKSKTKNMAKKSITKKPSKQKVPSKHKFTKQKMPDMSLHAPKPVPMNECPVCGSRNVHYNKERAELVCRECGEIHAQIV